MQRMMIDFLGKRIVCENCVYDLPNTHELKPLLVNEHSVAVVQWYGDHGELEFEDKRYMNLSIDSEFFRKELSYYEDLFYAAYEVWLKQQEENKISPEDLIRDKRNFLLYETDYLMLPDVQISEEDKKEVIAYRQALRDITKQSGFPWLDETEIPWPDKPTVLIKENSNLPPNKDEAAIGDTGKIALI